MAEDRIEELKARIAELKASLPAHSVPPSMILELEQLEEELEALMKAGPREGGAP